MFLEKNLVDKEGIVCGIYGKYLRGFLQDCVVSELQVNDFQRHRGPDFQSSKSLNNNRVLLQHQRLSIIDLSELGNQPMTTDCSRCQSGVWIVYNGELYNYKALKDDLVLKGHVFKSSTDTEVILHLYHEYGINMLSKLNGIFSFAIFDGREHTQSDFIRTNDLLVVRDPLGVKPLYYAQHDMSFTFASELKTLLLDKNLKREIDLEAVSDYMCYLWSPSPRTMLKNVCKLEPGNFLLGMAR